MQTTNFWVFVHIIGQNDDDDENESDQATSDLTLNHKQTVQKHVNVHHQSVFFLPPKILQKWYRKQNRPNKKS